MSRTRHSAHPARKKSMSMKQMRAHIIELEAKQKKCTCGPYEDAQYDEDLKALWDMLNELPNDAYMPNGNLEQAETLAANLAMINNRYAP